MVTRQEYAQISLEVYGNPNNNSGLDKQKWQQIGGFTTDSNNGFQGALYGKDANNDGVYEEVSRLG